jgi:AmiR/NasT family two-component response regulator
MNKLNDCILVVEDEFLIADHFVGQIEAMGRTVCGIADTAQKAIALACELRPSVVLMDVRLKGQGDGVDAAIAIHDAVGSRIVFVTGSREPENLRRMGLDHACAVLFKPLGGNELRIAIDAAMPSASARLPEAP